MSKTQEAIARARRTATEAKADTVVVAAELGTAYLLGSLEASGRIRDVPQVMGLPRTVTIAAAAKLLQYNSSGRMKQIAEGVGNSAASIAVFQFARGATVSGSGVGDEAGRMTARGRVLENASERAIGRGRAVSEDEELAGLEGKIPAVRAV